MYEVTMPKLSDSMTEGKIIEWKVKEGQPVHEGDVLAEIESDKASMELECFRSGIVSKIVKADGSEVAVGEVIAYIGDGSDVAGKKPPASAKPPAESQPGPAKVRTNLRRIADKPPAGEPPAPSANRISVSPYARKLLSEKGLDVAQVQGTGPGGRIVAADVEAASGAPGVPAKRGQNRDLRPDEDLPAVEVTADEADVEEASYRQRTQARLVMASKRLIPHFYITRSVDMRGIVARKEGLKERHGATITHVIMRACVKALEANPDVNRSYDRGRIIKWKGIRLGLAVDTDNGLTVAVLPDAQKLDLKQLAQAARELVERARTDGLTAADRRYPTFTISNLGMFGVEQFAPIIAPPSAVTLAVGAIVSAPVARDGKVEAGQVMSLTMSCDHRVIDGAQAARFLRDLCATIEDADALLK